MDRAHRPRHRVLAVALATLLVPLVVGTASAAPTRPTVTVTPTVSGANVSIAIDVNRAPNQIATCGYLLDLRVLRSCGTAQPIGTTASRYTVNLTNQALGKHTFVVALLLKDRGVGAGSTKFTIAAPRVFAIAWSNLDGNVGYQAGGTDVLIAELIDTNRDGVVSVGDTVIGGRYPLDHSASAFGTFGLSSDTVTALHDISPNPGIGVDVSSGMIGWVRGVEGEGVPFGLEGQPLILDIYDPSVSCVQAASDVIFVQVGDTLQPDTDVFPTSVCDQSDNSFVDVALNLP